MRRLTMFFLGCFMLCSGAAEAANCAAYPYTLTNGTTADANQVMANFNSILNCGNVNLVATAGGTLTSGILAGTSAIASGTVSGTITGGTFSGITLSGTTTLPGSGAISSAGIVSFGGAAASSSIFTAIAGASTQAAVFVSPTAGTQTVGIWNSDSSGANNFIVFYTESGQTARGSINYNRGGGLVAYNTTSDYRLKDIYGPFAGSGALLDAIPVHLGKMHGATMTRPMFVAHEVAQGGMPWAVTGEKDAVDAKGAIVAQQLNESAMVATLWAEVRSLRVRVHALEAQ